MYFLATAAQGNDIFSMALPFVLMIAAMYFLLIGPQRKKDKQAKQMRDNLEIGDEVITNGGIIGLIVSIKDDSVVIESGGDRNKIRILKSAIAVNRTVHEN